MHYATGPQSTADKNWAQHETALRDEVTSMTVKQGTTRESSDPVPAPPSGDGVASKTMKSTIAQQLFGVVEGPLRFGRYQVQEAIGEGGMGVVYAAWDESLGRRIALKLLGTRHGKSTRQRARMVREAQALAKLSHPNVVHVYEVGEHDDNMYVAMELVDGVSLQRWQVQDARSLDEIWTVYEQAGRGLVAAHRVGLVHRDFKPANALLGTDGRVRVADFGLALGPGLLTDSSNDRYASASDAATGRVTRTGALTGTPAYMAPEQFRGESPDARADQFAYCVSLFEALTRARPFSVESRRGDSPLEPVGSWKGVPRIWRGPMARGLAVDPKDRWPTLEALLQTLTRRLKWQRRAALWILPVVATAGAASWLMMESTDPCDDFPDLAAELWDVEHRGELQHAMTALEVPFAADAWPRIETRLERFATGWSDARAMACTTGPRTAVGPAAACLTRESLRFEAVLEELAAVNSDNVDDVHHLVALLEDPQRCLDSAATMDTELLPPTELLRELERGRAALAAGEYEAARSRLWALSQREGMTGQALATTLELQGRALGKLGREAEALSVLAASVAGANDPETSARGIVAWISELSEHERWESLPPLFGLLDASVSSDSAPGLRADILDLRGRVSLEANHDPSEAVRLHSEALQLRNLEGNPFRTAATRTQLANALSSSDDAPSVEQARREYESLLSFYEQTVGPRHPSYAAILFNLGLLAEMFGEPEQALRHLERASEIEASVYPATHELRARTTIKRAAILVLVGRLEAARPLVDEAWPAVRDLRATHSDHVAARRVLASLTMHSEEFVASLEHHRALLETEAGDADPFVHQNIAWISIQVGAFDDARRAIERARVVLDEHKEDIGPPVVFELASLNFRSTDAQLALGEGRQRQAVVIIDEIGRALKTLQIPEDAVGLLAQHRALLAELDELRVRASSHPHAIDP